MKLKNSMSTWMYALIAGIVIGVFALIGCDESTPLSNDTADTTDTTDTTVPTLDNLQVSAANGTTATVTATVSEATKLFWVVYIDGTTEPANAAALITDAGKAKTTPIVDNSGSDGQPVPKNGSVLISITGLTIGTNYNLYAVAQDATGNNSARSAKLDVSTVSPAITNFTALPAGGGTVNMALTWTLPAVIPNDATKLQLRYATTRAGLANATPVDIATTRAAILTTTSYTTMAPLVNATEYHFSILIVNTAGNSLPLIGAGFADDASYVTTGTVDSTLPGIPTDLRITTLVSASPSVEVTVAWQNAANAENIELSWQPATPGTGKTAPISASGTAQTATITLNDETTYTISAVAINSDNKRSSAARITDQRIDLTAPSAPPTAVSATALGNGTITVAWTAPDPVPADLGSYEVRWATAEAMLPDSPSGTQSVAISATSVALATADIDSLTVGTTYYFVVVARDGANALGHTRVSPPSTPIVSAVAPMDIDSNNNTLIDINNLETLNNIRHNLTLSDGHYKTSAGDVGLQCGANSTTACTGYELTQDLDFADGASYASGNINNEWRPNAASDSSGAVVEPANGANRGWDPIGSGDAMQFTAIFDGNGHTIKQLYSHNIANASGGRTGLFGQIGAPGVIRNLIIENGTVIGGTDLDHIGIAVGLVRTATIINIGVRGGSAHGGEGGADDVGGLIGRAITATITASYATGNVDGGVGNEDNVGGLVGNSSSTIVANYATGNVDGGAGNEDRVGGLVGNNNSGTITASYATGTANARTGDSGVVGGLVGLNSGGTITASYAIGTTNAGTGSSGSTGRLVGYGNNSTIATSYGFGKVTGTNTGSGSSAGSPLPLNSDGLPIGQPRNLTAANTIGCSDPARTIRSTCTTDGRIWVVWSSTANRAWDFGDATQIPVLRYTDYDGAHSGLDYRALFPNTVNLGTTLVLGQTSLRIAARTPDLGVKSVSISLDAALIQANITLSATVKNNGLANASASTLTYYRSSDAIINTGDTALSETDEILALSAGATSVQNISTTAPASAGTYYYGACVSVVADEGGATAANNCSTAVRLAVGNPPDLTVTDVELSTPNLVINATATLSAQVTSRVDDIDATDLTLTYYRSTDNAITNGDESIGSDSISTLSGGQTSPRQDITITAPATAGTYYYGACVSTVTAEADATNNCSAAVQLIVGAAAPDLVVVNPVFSSSTVLSEAPASLSATVRNDGNADATATSTLTYYRSDDATIDTGDTALSETDAIAALNASTTSAQNISFTAPEAAGTYYYGACVGVLPGENTGNNCSTAAQLTVLTPFSIAVESTAVLSPTPMPVLRIGWSSASAASNPTLTVSPSPNGFTAPGASDNAFLLPITAADNTLTAGTEYTFTVNATQLATPVSNSTTTTITLPVVLWDAGVYAGDFGFGLCNAELIKDSGAGAVPTALKAAGYTKGVFFGSTDTYDFDTIRTDSDALGMTGVSKLFVARVVDSTLTYTPVTNGNGQPILSVSEALETVEPTSDMYTWTRVGLKEALQTLASTDTGLSFWSMTKFQRKNEGPSNSGRYDEVYGNSCTNASVKTNSVSGEIGNHTSIGISQSHCNGTHQVLCLAR